LVEAVAPTKPPEGASVGFGGGMAGKSLGDQASQREVNFTSSPEPLG
jgi:hypothetical protein